MKTLNETLGIHIPNTPFLTADWPAPKSVKTLITTRNGGVSGGVFASLNVGAHVGDNPQHVERNREIVQQQVGVPVAYLNQIHSATVVRAADALHDTPDADASVDDSGLAACASMTADCLPVLFCDRAGTVVAAAHAGWRGLAGGVLQNTVRAMKVAPEEIMAYLGPAIGPDAFEVGQDVADAFCRQMPEAETAFSDIGGGKYLADIYALARMTLRREGVHLVYGGERCTVLERDTFFSYRRDGQTGRMVSLIWLDKSGV
ncbi:peptidoglycan editing factor PgeF [Neisseria sp. ZJ106]|uniref:Purine nucleoside phosphorylase n=1 Tax=Neisseria lisongii TaxID=2912188 RepID=A0ABY7RHD1_9NEIS|nr:peptidoglycan editing factor PgeF [Neisseria lisongii]MCF7521641.1 peptidoglycan editing factor PgeF [Neisseria lisongii]WCL70876.1 peptidoglycan editing factor PgeF [Neisseria lisongii]